MYNSDNFFQTDLNLKNLIKEKINVLKMIDFNKYNFKLLVIQDAYSSVDLNQ